MDLIGLPASNLDNPTQKFLRKRQEVILARLGKCGANVNFPVNDLFRLYATEKWTGCGFKIRDESPYRLYLDVKPEEANDSIVLEVAEEYSIANSPVLKGYRYALLWYATKNFRSNNEYAPEFVATMMRSIRFDHDDPPLGGEPLHHWHPNGVSEFRLECGKMTPEAVFLFGLRTFDSTRFRGTVRHHDIAPTIVSVECFFSAIAGLAR